MSNSLASEADAPGSELANWSIICGDVLLSGDARVVVASLPHTCTLEDLEVQVAARQCQLARPSASGAIWQPLRLAVCGGAGRPIAGCWPIEFTHHHSLVTLQGDFSSKHLLTVWLNLRKALLPCEESWYVDYIFLFLTLALCSFATGQPSKPEAALHRVPHRQRGA